MNKIELFLRNSLSISDEAIILAVLEKCVIRKLKKGDLLLRQGERPEGLSFLIKGLLRGYFVNFEGKETTECFGYREGTVAMPFGDMMQPSPIYIEAVESSEILLIPVETIEKLLRNNIEAVRIYNRMLLDGAAEHWDIKMALYQYSATERYLWFCRCYEGLIDLVPHKDVASFLGMSPVSLSRLRRQLKGCPNPDGLDQNNSGEEANI